MTPMTAPPGRQSATNDVTSTENPISSTPATSGLAWWRIPGGVPPRPAEPPKEEASNDLHARTASPTVHASGSPPPSQSHTDDPVSSSMWPDTVPDSQESTAMEVDSASVAPIPYEVPDFRAILHDLQIAGRLFDPSLPEALTSLTRAHVPLAHNEPRPRAESSLPTPMSLSPVPERQPVLIPKEEPEPPQLPPPVSPPAPRPVKNLAIHYGKFAEIKVEQRQANLSGPRKPRKIQARELPKNKSRRAVSQRAFVMTAEEWLREHKKT